MTHPTTFTSTADSPVTDTATGTATTIDGTIADTAITVTPTADPTIIDATDTTVDDSKVPCSDG